MWLLILTGLLAVAAGKENVNENANVDKGLQAKADDLVMLEIDVKEPSKRSPISATAVYGASPSQFVIRHGDEPQELSPEYLSLVQQYNQAQAQPRQQSAAPSRHPLPAYARQQQQLQQAYQNSRVPAIPPPRPRAQLHPQALAQAEAAAQIQAQADAQARHEAIQLARLQPAASDYAGNAYVDPKLGSFEQELLQLVSANQAQEFKLAQQRATQYAEQPQERYQPETASPRYNNQPAYQSAEDPNNGQYVLQTVTPRYQPKAAKAFRPSARYQNPAVHHSPQAIAQAQAEAEAQALAFQRISQASHNQHQQAAFDQIQANHELHRVKSAQEEIRVAEEQRRQQQASALEQIQQGHVSEAGRTHLVAQAEEEAHPRPVDHEARLKAQLKAQAHAEAAQARRAQEAAEYKAHADAIIKLQEQQQAHLRAQEDAHKNALALERNQLRAQVNAQALAQAQAEAIYKHQQQARAKAHAEAQAAAKAQSEARKADPNAPVVQYLIPTSVPLPPPSSYFTNEQSQKYQSSASSFVPRSTPKTTATDEQAAYTQVPINQPRQSYKYKTPEPSQSPIYVSPSGLAKKTPVKSLTIEEIIEQDQENSPHVVRLPALSGPQALTQEELSALINAGYTVTPVPPAKPPQRPYVEAVTGGYYTKKQRSPSRGEYDNYEEATPRQRRPIRKQRPIVDQREAEGEASEKVLYVIPAEEAFESQISQQE